MSFNQQWHNYEVARHWPLGSVVLLRIKIRNSSNHRHSFVLINNWNPDGQFWPKPEHEFQLVEEQIKRQ